MPLDPALVPMLDLLPEMDPSLTPEQLRSLSAMGSLSAGGDPYRPTTLDLMAPGPAGPIPVRLYTPAGGSRTPGLVVYYHGGGWVIGDLESHDAVCRELSSRAGAAVLSVDYRLAPEHPYPASVDDAWAALEWAREQAGELGADADRMAVAGDSAGGNLAAVMALLARDQALPLRLQVLVYPATDFSQRRPSFCDNGQGYMLTSTAIDWFEGHYAPDRSDWRASPMLAESHRNLAPAVILTCEFDPLRDEGDAYAAKLQAAGVPVTHRCYEGLIHGAFSMGQVVPSAQAMMDDVVVAVREAVG
jgi:acetyl esterase